MTGWGRKDVVKDQGLTLAFGRGKLPLKEIGKGAEMGLEGRGAITRFEICDVWDVTDRHVEISAKLLSLRGRRSWWRGEGQACPGLCYRTQWELPATEDTAFEIFSIKAFNTNFPQVLRLEFVSSSIIGHMLNTIYCTAYKGKVSKDKGNKRALRGKRSRPLDFIFYFVFIQTGRGQSPVPLSPKPLSLVLIITTH